MLTGPHECFDCEHTFVGAELDCWFVWHVFCCQSGCLGETVRGVTQVPSLDRGAVDGGLTYFRGAGRFSSGVLGLVQAAGD